MQNEMSAKRGSANSGKPKVDKNLCIGCGACASTCGEVFEMGEDGKSRVKEEADFEKNKDCIEQSITSCPAQAISVENAD